jgi:hypothetical protein
VRQQLIDFIREVQAAVADGRVAPRQFSLGALFGTSAEHEVPWLQFGRGYFDPCNVLYHPPGGATPAEMSVEEGVDKFLAFYAPGGTP